MYASGITFTGVQSASPSAGTLLGANNGLSVSTVNNTLAVLGQNVSQAGNPAALISNREIPMSAFRVNLFGGPIVFSDTQNAGVGEKLAVYDSLTGSANRPTAAIRSNWTGTSGNPVSLSIEATMNTPNLLANVLQTNVNGMPAHLLASNGSIIAADIVAGGSQYFGLTPQSNFTSFTGNAVCMSINNDIEPSSGGTHQYIAFEVVDFFGPTGGTQPYRAIEIGTTVNPTGGTSIVRGLYVNWSIITQTSRTIAIENVSGDVILNSTAGAFQGKVGIHGITTPTAWVHIAGGAAAAGSAPLKLTVGTLLTTAENGAFEFNGTNLFFTRAASPRETVFTGLSGATAPALTATPVFTSFYGGNTNALGDPNSWASVNIAGTTFKIPLYT